MTLQESRLLELCSAEYTAALVSVPDGNPFIRIRAHGAHPASGYEVGFHKSLDDVYPPQFSLWQLRPEDGSDVLTPFARSTSFEVRGEVEKVMILDAKGMHHVPVAGINGHTKLGPIQTVIGQKVKVDPAKSQPCGADSCANRGELSVTLPPGKAYIGTHYFTNADYPNDRADVYETGAHEVSWGRFSEAVYSPNANGQVVVTSYYYNRSNRTRLVQLTVDCQ